MKNLLTITILTIVLILMGNLAFLPWWFFLVPVFVLGVFLPLQKWEVYPFICGFVAGFMVWVLTSAYFEVLYEGEIMSTVAKIIDIKPYILRLAVGLPGGILTGLGVYSGYLLRKGREELKLELPGD